MYQYGKAESCKGMVIRIHVEAQEAHNQIVWKVTQVHGKEWWLSTEEHKTMIRYKFCHKRSDKHNTMVIARKCEARVLEIIELFWYKYT